MLQGLPEYHTEEMPTWAFDMSEGSRPVAYSMACDAPWDLGWVTWRLMSLRGRSAEVAYFRLAVVESAGFRL